MPLPPPEKMQGYIETARRRQRQRQEALCERRSRGLTVAKEAAALLRSFGASRVVLFGSVLDRERFHETSDLDIAVWDLPPKVYLEALGQLLALSEFSIDLVPAETASPYLREAIAQGMPL